MSLVEVTFGTDGVADADVVCPNHGGVVFIDQGHTVNNEDDTTQVWTCWCATGNQSHDVKITFSDA